MNRKRVLSFLLALVGIAIIVALIAHFGTQALAAALMRLGWGGLTLVTLMHLPVLLVLAAAWHEILPKTIPYRACLVGRAVRDGASEILPFSQIGGFMAGARAASLLGLPGQLAASSTLMDLTIEFAGKLPYIALGLGILAYLKPGEPSLPYLIGGFGAIFLLCVLAAILLKYGSTRFGVWLSRVRQKWPDVAKIFEMRFEGLKLFAGFLCHFGAWCLGGLECWVIFQLMRVPVTLMQSIVIDSVVTGLRGFVFFVPASLGIQETAYVVLCSIFGILPATALGFSLIRRARDFIIGGFALLLWQSLEKRRTFPFANEERAH